MPRALTAFRLLVFPALLAVCGCDTFFTIRGGVVDQATGAPLGGADVTLVLDKGYGEDDLRAETGADGKLNLQINEPEGSWATLTVVHPGYCAWSTQFKGGPKNEIIVKMIPIGRAPTMQPSR